MQGGEFIVWGLKTLKGLKYSHICYYHDVITRVDVAVTSHTSSFTLETGHQVHHIFFKDGRFTLTERYAPIYPTPEKTSIELVNHNGQKNS